MNLEAKLSPVDSKENVIMAIKEIFPNAKTTEIKYESSFLIPEKNEVFTSKILIMNSSLKKYISIKLQIQH